MEPSTAIARVLDNRHAAREATLLTLILPGPWPFTPGQVVELAVGPGNAGYFAIASAPSEARTESSETRLRFLVKAKGSESEPLMCARAGDEVSVAGPLGRGFELPSPDRAVSLLFVSGGTAFAAVRSALAELMSNPRDGRAITVVTGVRDLADLGFVADITCWAAHGVVFRVAVTSGPLTPPAALHERAGISIVRGRVQAHLDDLVVPDTLAFIAGSESFEEEVGAALADAGLPAERVQRNYRPDARG